MTDVTFKVTAKSENKTKTIVQAKGFSMTIDEPKAIGGTNEGASPLEYLLGALSGCISVLCHMVASELGFQLNGVELELEGNFNPAYLLGKSDVERSGFKEIQVNIHPDTDADEATLEKWMEIVKLRCPVSDNIANSTPVKLNLK